MLYQLYLSRSISDSVSSYKARFISCSICDVYMVWEDNSINARVDS